MKCAVAICFAILVLSVVSTSAQPFYGYPGYGPGYGPRWGGPGFFGPQFGQGRGLGLLASAALIGTGTRFGRTLGSIGLFGSLVG